MWLKLLRNFRIDASQCQRKENAGTKYCEQAVLKTPYLLRCLIYSLIALLLERPRDYTLKRKALHICGFGFRPNFPPFPILQKLKCIQSRFFINTLPLTTQRQLSFLPDSFHFLCNTIIFRALFLFHSKTFCISWQERLRPCLPSV